MNRLYIKVVEDLALSENSFFKLRSQIIAEDRINSEEGLSYLLFSNILSNVCCLLTALMIEE